MADITVTAANVRPLNDTLKTRGIAGGSGSVGDLVYMASDGDWEQADADAVASAQAKGVVVAVNGFAGATTFAAGDALDIVTYGPVVWGTSLTYGAPVYVSTTAGKGDQTAPAATGDFPYVVGWAFKVASLDSPALFVAPQTAVPTVNG